MLYQSIYSDSCLVNGAALSASSAKLLIRRLGD